MRELESWFDRSPPRTPSPRWNGVELGQAVGDEARPWRDFLSFAADSEASTEPAYAHLERCLQADEVIGQAGQAGQEWNVQRERIVCDFKSWLVGWIMEERNHEAFFRAAVSSLESRVSRTMGQSNSAPQGQRSQYSVLQPIPAGQPLERTLLFLLFSEAASMAWYRAWRKRIPSGSLRCALGELHRDEASHFSGFFWFCIRICSLKDDWDREIRRVYLQVSRSLRMTRIGDAGKSSTQAGLGDINWWEHPIFRTSPESVGVLKEVTAIVDATRVRLLASRLPG
jgi:hypothetical protein